MSNPNSPELLTTHQYIVGAMESFGADGQHELRHSITTMPLEPSEYIPVEHIFEARLVVPVKELESGELKLNGPQRLRMGVWTPYLPRRIGHFPGTTTRSPDGFRGATEQRCLAQVEFWFNTKRTLEVRGGVTLDGKEAGLDAENIRDDSGKNLLLSELAELEQQRRSLGIARAANLIVATSMYTGTSYERKTSVADLYSIVRDIHIATGKRIPESLQNNLPHISYEMKGTLPLAPEDPSTTSHTTTIDTINSSGQREFTHWKMTQYDGHRPVNPGHLALSLDGEETGMSFGIDVTQLTLGQPHVEVTATTPEEARQMVDSLYRAVSGLRRYSNSIARG